MNRIIKFRAWDKVAGRMHPGDHIIGPRAEMSVVVTTPLVFKLNGFFDELSKGLVFMQFTGLTDKNGKEIYEGDIVRTDKPMPSGFVNNNIGIVKWVDYDAKFMFRCKGLGIQEPSGNCEVIGNIYENPKL